MHAFTATPQVAADPAMPATVLAEIARDRPELRPYLAAHPAACRQRLGWLVVLGGPRSTPSCGRGAADGPRRPRGGNCRARAGMATIVDRGAQDAGADGAPAVAR